MLEFTLYAYGLPWPEPEPTPESSAPRVGSIIWCWVATAVFLSISFFGSGYELGRALAEREAMASHTQSGVLAVPAATTTVSNSSAVVRQLSWCTGIDNYRYRLSYKSWVCWRGQPQHFEKITLEEQ